VDSLIDTNEMLKDWECMTDLLLEEPGRDETGTVYTVEFEEDEDIVIHRFLF